MATATKNARAVVASTTNSGGGSTSGTQDLTSALGALLTMRKTTGGTAPSTPCDVTVLVSADNSDWYEVAKYSRDIAANTTAEFDYQLAPATMYVKVLFEGNDDQSVTVEAELHELSSIG